MTKTRYYTAFAVLGGLLLVALAVILLLPPQKPVPPAEVTTETTVQTLLPENPFAPADFAYAGDYLTCLTAPSVRGIDISTHQKEIDFQQVKEAGFEFVMIRLGYRGSIEGLLLEDEWAQRNYQGAKAAGLKVGAYFFSQSISREEAIEEANYAMQLMSGWELDMPLVYDWEYLQDTYRNAHVDARMLTDFTKAFCETVEQAGYEAMVYFNPSLARDRLYLEELTDYSFWLAMYTEDMDFPHRVDMWQYTCEGAVPGIVGNVDINLYFPQV